MKKDEVKVGQAYRVKVSGKIADVRITGENRHGGWDGVNVATNRQVRIKSAQRLRSVVQRPAKRKKIVTLAEYEAEAGQTKATSPARAKTVSKATKDATKAPKADTAKRGAGKAKKPSGLDAAAKVLGEAEGPLACGEMVQRMLAKGYWASNGKTPAATIYSAIIREIRDKGEASRFAKVERGKFTLNS